MTKRKGKIEIEIDRAWEDCRWMWDVWVDDKFCDNGVEDTAKAAMDAALKAMELWGDA